MKCELATSKTRAEVWICVLSQPTPKNPRQGVQKFLDFPTRPTLANVDRNFLSVENRLVVDLMPSFAMQSRMDFATAV